MEKFFTPTFFIIVFFGAYGGMLFFLQTLDESVRSGFTAWQNARHFAKDLFFGAAGGLVLFMVLPSPPDFNQPGWESLKILALAILGGYGGRFLMIKIAQDLNVMKERQGKFEELQRDLEEKQVKYEQLQKELEDKQKFFQEKQENIQKKQQDFDEDFQAYKASQSWLDLTTPPERKQVYEKLKKASLDTREDIAERVDRKRFDLVLDVLSGTEKKRQYFNNFIPIFEVLVQIYEEETLSKDPKLPNDGRPPKDPDKLYARLAYLLKDKAIVKENVTTLTPDWSRAYEMLGKALDRRDSEKNRSKEYEMNRLICLINLQPDLVTPNMQEQLAADFATVWGDGGQKNTMMSTSDIIAPKLHVWLLEHHFAEVVAWLKNDHHRQFCDLWLQALRNAEREDLRDQLQQALDQQEKMN